MMPEGAIPYVRLKAFPRCEGVIRYLVSPTVAYVDFSYGSTLFPETPLSALEPTPYGWQKLFEALNNG